MSDKYSIHVVVPTRLVGSVLELINGEGEVLHVEPFQAPPSRSKRSRRYLGGVKDKGVTGRALVLETLKDKPASRDELIAAFKAKGFAPSSCSSTLSALRAQDAVRYEPESQTFRRVK